MTILASGTANGAVSILHAMGSGRGCSIPIKLETRVNLHDEPMQIAGDKHDLLSEVSSVWRKNGFPLPPVFGWEVISDIPIGQGLKSSSALACAALRALDKASWTGLSDFEIVDLAVEAQIESGCTITGSMDDTWAAASSGWKVVDPTVPSVESVLFEGDVEVGLSVIIGLRGPRKYNVEIDDFSKNSQIFDRAFASLLNGSIMDSLSSNGMAVASSIDDFEALRTCNMMIASGALAAGISGSGPAIAVVCYESEKDFLGSQLKQFCEQVLITEFVPSEQLREEA
jgi:shikimate kinase